MPHPHRRPVNKNTVLVARRTNRDNKGDMLPFRGADRPSGSQPALASKGSRQVLLEPDGLAQTLQTHTFVIERGAPMIPVNQASHYKSSSHVPVEPEIRIMKMSRKTSDETRGETQLPPLQHIISPNRHKRD